MADLMALRAAVLGSIANVASKSFDRDLLTDGDSHEIEAKITGTVDGRKFSFGIDTMLTIGHATEYKSKSAPSAEAMLAFVLQTAEENLGPKAYSALVGTLIVQFNKKATIEADEKYMEVVDNLTTSFTETTMKPKRGNVNVIPTTKTVEMKISNSKLA